MGRRPRRNHPANLKAKVALAAVLGDRTLAGLPRQLDAHPKQIAQWKTGTLDGAAQVFGVPTGRDWEAGGDEGLACQDR